MSNCYCAPILERFIFLWRIFILTKKWICVFLLFSLMTSLFACAKKDVPRKMLIGVFITETNVQEIAEADGDGSVRAELAADKQPPRYEFYDKTGKKIEGYNVYCYYCDLDGTPALVSELSNCFKKDDVSVDSEKVMDWTRPAPKNFTNSQLNIKGTFVVPDEITSDFLYVNFVYETDDYQVYIGKTEKMSIKEPNIQLNPNLPVFSCKEGKTDISILFTHSAS